MKIFEVTKEGRGYTIEKEDLAAATAWAVANLVNKFTIVEIGTIPDPTPEQRLQKNRDFGQTLLQTFLQDNVDIIIARGYNFTTEETEAMDAKFQYFFRLAEYGSIPQIATLLPGIPTDALFTQARKDKYAQMITDFFAQ
jgi:hypothetical protein